MQKAIKKLFILGGIGTICALSLRMLQIVAISEAQTGFFSRDFAAFGTAISILIFAIIAAVGIYAISVKKTAGEPPVITKGFAVANFLLAAAIIYEALFAKVSASIPTWQLILQVFTGLLTAIAFLYKGYTAFSGHKTTYITEVLPIVFWLTRLIVTFATYISVSVIADHIFETAALCFVLIYFLVIGEYNSGYKQMKNAKKILPLSVVTFILCAVHALPQLLLLITGRGEFLHADVVTYITDCALLFYIPYHTVLCLKGEPLEEKNADEFEIIEI